MNLALLGSDEDALELARAARDAGHQLVWACDLLPTHTELQASADVVAPATDWEVVLDHELSDGVIVGRGTTDEEQLVERLRLLVTDERHTLTTFPIAQSVLPYYELDMIQQENHGVLLHYHALSGASIWSTVADWLSDGHPDIGKIRQLRWVRNLGECSRPNVIQNLSRDAEVVRGLNGGVSKVSAFGPQIDDDDYGNLTIQMSGPSDIPIHWCVARASDRVSAEVSLIGDDGSFKLSLPRHATGNQIWRGEVSQHGKSEVMELPCTNDAAAAIQELQDKIRQGQSSNAEAYSWNVATRAMEIVDAVQLSLQRGRTVEVQEQQLTEQLAFRGVMSAFGCGLMLLASVLLLVVGVLGDTFGFRLFRYWPFLILGLLGLFLLLQLVPHTKGNRRTGKAEKT